MFRKCQNWCQRKKSTSSSKNEKVTKVPNSEWTCSKTKKPSFTSSSVGCCSCRCVSSITQVEDNSNREQIGLGESGEVAVISVTPKKKKQESIIENDRPNPTTNSTTTTTDEPMLVSSTAVTHDQGFTKEDVSVATNEIDLMPKEELRSKSLIRQPRSLLPFRRVQSGSAVHSSLLSSSTGNQVHSDPSKDPVILSRQRFSLLTFRRNANGNTDPSVEKVYSDVGTEYAIVKVVSKLDHGSR